MNLDEEKYLEYREKCEEENIVQNNCFKYNREILVISSNGELEEIKTEGYHFEKLYERFKEYDAAVEEDEFITSVVGAKNGFVVFIIDAYSVSMFYPSSFTYIQKETLMILLSKISSNIKVYAGIVDEKEDLNLIEWNSGEEMSLENLKELINMVPINDKLNTKNI